MLVEAGQFEASEHQKVGQEVWLKNSRRSEVQKGHLRQEFILEGECLKIGCSEVGRERRIQHTEVEEELWIEKQYPDHQLDILDTKEMQHVEGREWQEELEEVSDGVVGARLLKFGAQ